MSSDSFFLWNDALAAHFFNEQMAGRRILLHVTDALIDRIASNLSSSAGDYIAGLKRGVPWATRSGFCQKALQAMHGWRARNLAYPPYFGYLALFSLAADRHGDYATFAYYPKLRDLLGEPERTAPPSFEKMLSLWDDLERWANVDLNGRLGDFRVDIMGEHWIHVGVPFAQCILNESERSSLHEFYAESGIDPLQPPSEDDLIRSLLNVSPVGFRRHTLALLRNKSAPLRHILLDVISQDLIDWDGSLESRTGTRLGKAAGVLHVALKFDALGHCDAFLRASVASAFPTSTLFLTDEDMILPPLTAREDIVNLSTRLLNVQQQVAFSAATVDWSSGLTLNDKSGIRFSLPGSRTRVFTKHPDLADWLEVRALVPETATYIAVHESARQSVWEWAKSECVGFVEHRDAVLPDSWSLCRVERVVADSIAAQIPQLSFRRNVLLKLLGGIREGRGNTFYRFAPPAIELIGGDPTDSIVVKCDTTPCARISASQYSLPRIGQSVEAVTISASRGEEVIRRATITFADIHSSAAARPLIRAKAEAQQIVIPERLWRVCLAELSHGRLFCVGRYSGQIEEVKHEHDVCWSPVWLVQLSDRGRAIYCGTNIANEFPQVETGTATDSRLWKEVLWHRRKVIERPRQRPLATLWDMYLKAAADV